MVGQLVDLLVLFSILSKGYGRSKFSPEIVAGCPPPLGSPSPPGCDLSFVEDLEGDIPCEDHEDCPLR